LVAPRKRARSTLGAASAAPASSDAARLIDAGRDQLLATLDKQRRAGDFCDVQVVVPCEGAADMTFPAHRNVLSARSGYMEGLFRSKTADATAPTIALPDMDASVVGAVIEFIYTGSCRLNESRLGALLAAAARLQVESLKAAAADAIEARLSPDNCLAWLASANDLALPKLAAAAKLVALKGFEAAVTGDEALKGVRDQARNPRSAGATCGCWLLVGHELQRHEELAVSESMAMNMRSLGVGAAETNYRVGLASLTSAAVSQGAARQAFSALRRPPTLPTFYGKGSTFRGVVFRTVWPLPRRSICDM
jgi:hypothetical protein